MTIQNDVPIIQKVYNFYRLFYDQIDHFPKKSREVLIKKIEQIILELLELFFLASYSSKDNKLQLLNRANTKVDFLKTLIRLLYDLKIINQIKYIELEKQLQEIGKMLGGWLKFLKG